MRQFYALYADYLMGVCSRYIGNDDDLKDVFQDCFVQILTHIHTFSYRGEGSLRAWSTKIAVNQALQFLKEQKRAEWSSLQWDVADEPEADDPPLADIPIEVIHELIRQLPLGYRTVFNLYVFENKSHDEIAQMLHIRRTSSASQLHRAKNMLAREIEKYRNSKQMPQ